MNSHPQVLGRCFLKMGRHKALQADQHHPQHGSRQAADAMNAMLLSAACSTVEGHQHPQNKKCPCRRCHTSQGQNFLPRPGPLRSKGAAANPVAVSPLPVYLSVIHQMHLPLAQPADPCILQPWWVASPASMLGSQLVASLLAMLTENFWSMCLVKMALHRLVAPHTVCGKGR